MGTGSSRQPDGAPASEDAAEPGPEDVRLDEAAIARNGSETGLSQAGSSEGIFSRRSPSDDQLLEICRTSGSMPLSLSRSAQALLEDMPNGTTAHAPPRAVSPPLDSFSEPAAMARPRLRDEAIYPAPQAALAVRSIAEMLAMPAEEFAEACRLFVERFNLSKEDGLLSRQDLEKLVHALVGSNGVHVFDDERLSAWLASQERPNEGAAEQPEAFTVLVRRLLEELAAEGLGACVVPSSTLYAAANESSRTLHSVKLDRSQYFRLPEGVPLRVLVGVAEITDCQFEPNEELACEIRLYPPRNPLMAAFFPESSPVGLKTTCTAKGGFIGKGGQALWLFGEELAFEGDAVSEERRADGALQAQIVLERPSGEKLASTALFPVPTEHEKTEPLWTRAVFSKRVGQVSVAAGWVGPDLVGWLSGEVLRRASSGKWSWVVETLSNMSCAELHTASGNADEDGRNVLHYAAMSAASEHMAAKVVDMLLVAKADLESADNEGLTAVHYAAFAGQEHVASALLRAGAEPNAQAEGGISPLMLASLAGREGSVQALLQAGARPETQDDNGLTAACWVCLGCGEPRSRSGRQALHNSSPEEARAAARISKGLHEAIERRRSPASDLWGGPDRRDLLGHLTERLYRAAPPGAAAPRQQAPAGGHEAPANPGGNADIVERVWLPLVREAARPGPVHCGCFAELYSRLRRLEGLRIPILSSVLRTAMARSAAGCGRSEEQLCRMLLRECGELPISGSLPDGRTLTEAALDLGWDEVAILLCDRGAVLDTDSAGQARALRAAVEGGRKELAKRLVGQWAQARDAWQRPSLPAAEGLAECPVCFASLCERAGVLFNEQGKRACSHLLCLNCASQLGRQFAQPKCPMCREPFQPPAHKLPDPREDPGGWFEFFDEAGAGYLDRQLLEKVLPAVAPVDTGRLEAALRGQLWAEWDPAGEGRISRSAFCAERGLLRWLIEHLTELQEDRARGAPPNLEQDRAGWFRHWARAGASKMGRGEVLRAVLKSAGTSSLEASAVAASREWIERCWLMWDRDGNGCISFEDFCAEGGLADMMLQQSALAAAKRLVRRMELEPHDIAVLVACCQQLVECAVGVLPEDPPERWPDKACRRLRERASRPNRAEFEAALGEGVEQVVAAMERNQSSAKLFSWGCRALAALSFAPQGTSDPEGCGAALRALLGSHKEERHSEAAKAPTDTGRGPAVLWRFVLQGFTRLLPEHASDGQAPPSPSQAHAPGAIREAGLCALAALRALVDVAGSGAGDEVCAALALLLSCSKAGDAGSEHGGPLVGIASWIQTALGIDAGGAPSPSLVTWAAAATAVLAADGRKLAEMLLAAPRSTQVMLLPSLEGLMVAIGEGQQRRPPTTARGAHRLAQALLAGLHKLPPASRAGAGAVLTADTMPHRPRIRSGTIAVGDAVRLHSDLEKAKREQDPSEHFGGWSDRMAFCLDYPGRVVEIPRRTARMPEVLRISHGAMGCWCWNVSVVAEVIENAGLLPFEESEEGPGVALTIGDEVRICASVEDVRRLQGRHGGHGEWSEAMALSCGRVGRLEAIDKAGWMKVLIPGLGSHIWNPAALRAPYAQRWEVAFCERLTGNPAGTLPMAMLAALMALGGRLDEGGLRAAFRELQVDLAAQVATSATAEVEEGGPGATGQGPGTASCSRCWSSLAAAALAVNPLAAAAALRAAQVTATLGDVARSGAMAAAERELTHCLPGSSHAAAAAVASASVGGSVGLLKAEAGLLEVMEAWWNSLPVAERRARCI